MKTIASALVALSVIVGVATTSANAADARFGSQDWWTQQDTHRN